MEKQNKGMNLIQKLYHYRLRIDRKGTPIVNLSSLFCIPALLLAPWVSIGGIVAALVLGYHIRLETEGEVRLTRMMTTLLKSSTTLSPSRYPTRPT